MLVNVSHTMANDEYHAHPSLSRSVVHRFKSPIVQQFVDRGGSIFGGSAATELGTHFDTAFGATIEKRSLDDVFVSAPRDVLAADGSRRGKAFTEWKQSLAPGAAEVSSATRSQLSDMILSLSEHKRARELMEQTMSTQTSVFWRDGNGFDRKARADGVTEDLWYDVKTTSSEWRDLYKSFVRFGYHWQAAWYTEAARESGYDKPFRMPFIVIQSGPPYEVKVLTIPDRLVEQASREITETLYEMRRRRETQKYLPEEYGQEEELSVPEYVYSG
jgi:hypothetical protein